MKKGYLLILLTLIFSVSCNKKWKKTASVEFKTEFSQSGLSGVSLTFQSGNIILDHFEFEGERKRGEDVHFSEERDNLYSLDITTGNSSPQLVYDIPQGTYSSIDVRLRIKASSNTNSITFNGTYINSLSQPVPVLFNCTDDFSLRLSAGSGNITFVEGQASTGFIRFNIGDWFSTITAGQLDSADLTNINSVPTIVIDETHNDNLYETIIDRIGDFESLTF